MPLVLEPSRIPEETLRELLRSLREDLAATVELVQQPPAVVRDPASIETAGDLLRSTTAMLDLPGPRTRGALVAEVNSAYATLVAVIDLVKSHTDVPRVPRGRPKP